MRKSLEIMLLIGFVSLGLGSFAQMAPTQTKENEPKIKVGYGSKGFQFETPDGKNKMHIQWRLQFRSAFPYGDDPLKGADFDERKTNFWIKRARMKVGGHGYTPNLTYYLEYDVVGSKLLDYRIMYKFGRGLNLKVGQWKVHYTRERVISSGKQQTVERSILNRQFTLDRQQGISLYGNIGPKNMLNFSYWLSTFTGTGRGQKINDDDSPLIMARLQWNPMGKPMKFTGSDLKFSKTPQISLAVAGAINRTNFTRFSSSGGQNLEGFSDGKSGQYEIKQALAEAAFKYKGFSLQSEAHIKQVHDHNSNIDQELVGGLLQGGMMLHTLAKPLPKGLELYGRYATFYPFKEIKTNQREEYTMGFNYFISGHRFKLTAESSFLQSGFSETEVFEGWRHRLQVEVSF